MADPVELKNALVSLGSLQATNVSTNILKDLDTEGAGGLTCKTFLKLATGKLG